MGAWSVTAAASAVAAMTLLAACGGGNSTTAGPTSDGLFVGYVDGTCANSWRTTVKAELDEEVKAHPEITKYVYRCAQGDLNKANSDIQSLTAQGVDVLLTFADFGKAMAPALKAAKAKGVTVVPFIVDPGDAQSYDALVQDDLDTMGKQMADFFIGKLKGKGNVVAIAGAAGNPWDGQLNAAMKKQLESTSDMKFLDSAAGDWEPAKSGQAMAGLLQKFPQIDAVYASEATTIGPILDQFRAAGRKPPLLGSLDVNGVAGTMVKDMPTNSTLGWGYFSARTWGVREALKVGLEIRGGKKPAQPVITLQNSVTDCAATCQKTYRPDMPATWIFTSKVPAESMKAQLGK
jgi:ribose transport system substrate-binding protein